MKFWVFLYTQINVESSGSLSIFLSVWNSRELGSNNENKFRPVLITAAKYNFTIPENSVMLQLEITTSKNTKAC